MAGANETSLNADAARPAAAHLRGSARSLADRWGDLTAKIQKFNETKPWGDDKAGKEFEKAYLEGEHPMTEAVKLGKEAVDKIKEIAEAIPYAIEGTVETERQIFDMMNHIENIQLKK